MTRRLPLIAAALAATLLAPRSLVAQHGGDGTRPPLAPASDVSQFAFLLGQWELTVTPKVSSLAAKIHGAPKLLGTWKAWRAIDGFGIEDEMRIVDRSGNPSALALNVRLYDPNTHRWLLTTFDAYRSRVSSGTGDWKDGQMIVSGQGTDAEGKPYLTRTRWYDIGPGAFKFQQDVSTDGGKTWDEGRLRIEAKRVAAEAPR